ncbi:peptidoglycan editing factor PgeF [Thermomonas brevis]|uniref:Purine nucleoside phosphorylase n=1 Tax=Thermomonas brevis TaxID=215691 RepID=A0A7G9QWA9_9GAMM|nr:peptidoglycan editing factor PgeF [Thermomonas brevis]QNN47634.1 peptidoglycan editing factor PgeF [Thermomonas brevis]
MSAFLGADWPAPPGVRALTTTRFGLGMSQPPFDTFNLGSRCGDDAEAVAENRRQLEAALALPSAPRWLRQMHGVEVARFAPSLSRSEGEGLSSAQQAEATPSRLPPSLRERGGESEEPEADAAVTSTLGTVLAILTADCLPVVLAAKDGSEIAAAHAGWRSLCAGVLEATVAAMRTPPDRLMAWLGPAAGPQAYEIGEEVFDAFTARDGRARMAFLPTRPGHWKVDLYTLARQRLLDAGVFDVHGGGLCTISDPARFFSHRRDGRSGRIATLAWIAP